VEFAGQAIHQFKPRDFIAEGLPVGFRSGLALSERRGRCDRTRAASQVLLDDSTVGVSTHAVEVNSAVSTLLPGHPTRLQVGLQIVAITSTIAIQGISSRRFEKEQQPRRAAIRIAIEFPSREQPWSRATRKRLSRKR